MKVFVTGVAGQLGHDVMNELNKRGYTQGAVFRVCQPYFGTQTAMTAHIALMPLKSAAVRHGINAIVADIYNVAAAYDNSLADTQKILLRQSR